MSNETLQGAQRQEHRLSTVTRDNGVTCKRILHVAGGRRGARLRSAEHGFTLLEILVALAIFAVIGASSYAALMTTVNVREELAGRHEEIGRLMLLFAQLERDVRYMQPRAARDYGGRLEQALVGSSGTVLAGEEFLRFTASRPDSHHDGVQRLQRVSWRLESEGLYRVAWATIDRAQGTPQVEQHVFGPISGMTVRLLDRSAQSDLESIAVWTPLEGLPRAIEIVLTTTNGREYRRVLEVAAGAR